MSNFTDLEEAIMDNWNVVTDLRNFIRKHPDDPKLQILSSFADIYDYKMDRLYDLYEDCLRDYYDVKVIQSNDGVSDSIINNIAEPLSDYDGDIPRENWVEFARAILKHKEESLPW